MEYISKGTQKNPDFIKYIEKWVEKGSEELNELMEMFDDVYKNCNKSLDSLILLYENVLKTYDQHKNWTCDIFRKIKYGFNNDLEFQKLLIDCNNDAWHSKYDSKYKKF